MFKNLFNDKNFYISILSIAIPISIQSLFETSLSMVDQLMIGQLGEVAIASIGLGGRLLFILLFILMGLSAGTSVFISQFWGNKQRDKLGQVLGASLAYGFILVVIFSTVSILLPESVLALFTSDPKVIAGGSSYLQIIGIGYFPLLLILIYSAALRSTKHVKLPMYTGLMAVIMNTILNYMFIFGNFGAPEMGVKGAAVATCLSRTFEAVVLLFIIYWRKLPGAVKFRQMLTLPKSFFLKFSAITIPLILNELAWVTGDSMFSLIYGRMGTVEIASMTMTFPIQGLTVGLFTGLSSAAAIMLGHKIGANKHDNAFDYAKRFLLLGFIFTIVTGVIVALASGLYVEKFGVSDQVKEFSITLLQIFGFILWIKVLNMIMGNGILRSGGHTKFTLYVDMLGLWGIGVPLGLFSAFILELPIYWVYLIISFEEVVRFLFCFYRVKSKKWILNLVENE